MNKPEFIIDDATAEKVTAELSVEIANAVDAAVQLVEQGKVGDAQELINQLCSSVRYDPMVGVIPNGNVKLTEHPVIKRVAQALANSSRFGESEEAREAGAMANPLLAENLKEEQQRHDALRDHLEKIYRQELEDALFQSEHKMLSKPDDQHHIEVGLLALLFLLRDNLKAAGKKAYSIALNTLGAASPLQANDVESAAIAYAKNRASKLENSVSKLKSTIQNSIQRGIAGGESSLALARRVKEGFAAVSDEVDLIAKTEPQVVYGLAQHEALKLAGFDRKRWITQNDERVRHSHTLCEAQGAIPANQHFHNGLQFPGDPNGPASEVIGCRCYLLGA